MKISELGKEDEKIKPARRKTKKEITRFYLIFPLLLLIIFFVFPYVNPYLEPQIIAVSSWTAGFMGFVLNFFGINTHNIGPVLSLNNLSIRVVGECLGVKEMLIFFAVVLASPANYKKKLWGILLGIPVLYIVNILRMLLITAIGNWNPKTFNFLHLYFWQVAGILIIGGIWLFWMENIVKYERETSHIHS